MENKTAMWDLPIAEFKIGGINGILFRTGQYLNIFNKIKGESEAVEITQLMRAIDDLGEEIFLVFGKREGNDDDYLIKSSKGEPVYVTFDVFKD